MNKTSFKIFICFTLTASLIAVILLFVNFAGFAFVLSDTKSPPGYASPQKTLKEISESLRADENGFYLSDLTLSDGAWCVLIDEGGKVVWSENKPEDVPESFSLNDIAKMTRWFLNDYPVYVRAEDYGLLVLGMPKNSVGKYEMIYSMHWFESLPKRVLAILALNLLFAAVLAFLFGIGLYGRIKTLTRGIDDLKNEKRVRLSEKGIFREIYESVNSASDAMARKNAALAARDDARSNWVSGVSHDVRTPLALIVGHAENISENAALDEETRGRAKAIVAQGLKIKKLIEDLNLISSLEYDMQPAKKSEVKICPLLRKVVTDFLNSGAADGYDIELTIKNERSVVFADETLIERAVFNLINNSVAHNEKGCGVKIRQSEKNGRVVIEISDNGKGVSDNVLKNIEKIPKSSHGLGLPMAYRIIRAHGGSFKAENSDGFHVTLELPVIVR